MLPLNRSQYATVAPTGRSQYERLGGVSMLGMFSCGYRCTDREESVCYLTSGCYE